MKFKKIAAAVLAAAVLAATPAAVGRFSPFSVTANAEDTLTEGDWKYIVNSGGTTATITKYTGSDADVIIPETLGGKTVTVIGTDAFRECTSLTSVTIPDDVKIIGQLAFCNCTSLTSVTIPDSVAEIYNGAFYGCKSLTGITIPDSVTKICTYAFNGCTSLASVTIPDSVTTIGDRAFYGCTSLETITVEENNANYSSINGILFSNDKTELVRYPAGKKDISYTIPDSVTTIDGAFADCTSLTSITIPYSVTKIRSSAFIRCTSLTSVTIPDSMTIIDLSVFYDCTSLTSVTIPNSVTTICEAAFYLCSSLETVYYGGTKAEWEAIVIVEGNECLTNAEIICTDGIINERESETSEPDTSEPTSSDTSEPTSSDTSEPTTSDTSEPTSSDTSNPTDPDLFIKENEVSTEIEVPTEAADIPESDRITSITINPAFNMKNKNDNNVELDLSKITIKAEAIYDEEGLKRAEEALGETIKGNKHYNLLDLTLLYNGKDFSNGYEGLVKVIIPLPKGHRDKTFSCFRLTEVDGKTVKELIPGEQTEDSYIIYLEHFSLYALVADANPDDGEKQPEESKDPAESAPVIPGDTDKNSGSNSGNDQANTGIALAAAPVVIACAAVIAVSKKRK